MISLWRYWCFSLYRNSTDPLDTANAGPLPRNQPNCFTYPSQPILRLYRQTELAAIRSASIKTAHKVFDKSHNISTVINLCFYGTFASEDEDEYATAHVTHRCFACAPAVVFAHVGDEATSLVIEALQTGNDVTRWQPPCSYPLVFLIILIYAHFSLQ